MSSALRSETQSARCEAAKSNSYGIVRRYSLYIPKVVKATRRLGERCIATLQAIFESLSKRVNDDEKKREIGRKREGGGEEEKLETADPSDSILPILMNDKHRRLRMFCHTMR